jgi:3-dehydro-L-gulonate 2-dehydrogenase
MYSSFFRVLINEGYSEERANLSAKLFADASRDGVYTHGLNRFVKFIASIKNGCVNINAVPTRIEQIGAIERWDGNRGPGNLNAYFCMDRAIEIAKTFGIGCVALKNTNHWMRPGAYGLQAADKGCIGICWTNTVPNMPPWGAKEAKLGNNPIVFAVPKEDGHILLDMAVSMFSYGKLESYARRDEMLPVDAASIRMGIQRRTLRTFLKQSRHFLLDTGRVRDFLCCLI